MRLDETVTVLVPLAHASIALTPKPVILGTGFIVTVNAGAVELVHPFALVTDIVPLYTDGFAPPGIDNVIGALPGNGSPLSSLKPCPCAVAS